MLKSVSVCAALIFAAAVFAGSAEAGPGGFKGVSGGMGKMGMGMAGPKMGMGMAGPKMGMAPMGMGPGKWSGKGNWSGKWAGNWQGGKWAGNWHRGHFRRGGFWPWWGVGAGVALAAGWPYYGGYGYDSCIQWVPDYGWVNVCGYPYGGYGYW